jgi:hypothetical protein
MPSEPQPPTLFQVARRAVEICDPEGGNESLTEYLRRFEDRDEPVTAVADPQTDATSAAFAADPEQDDPVVTMAAAVTTYLAFKRAALAADGDAVLRLAARSEFDGQPPDKVRDWLSERGVDV